MGAIDAKMDLAASPGAGSWPLPVAVEERSPEPGSGTLLLEARGVTFGYEPGCPVVDAIDLVLRRGERLALVGANGVGKSTLLRLLNGTLVPQRGEIRWQGRPLRELRRRELAQRIAVVPQSIPSGPLDDLTVEEVVALGRTPYAGWLGLRGETAADRAAVAEALQATDLQRLAGRPLAALSGGERQRALLALALAQQAQLLLLDEPTRHLDPHHQVAFLSLVAELTETRGLTVVAVLHDLNLAACYFPRIVLLYRGRIAADGPAAAVLTGEMLARAYGHGLQVVPHPSRPDIPLVLPQAIPQPPGRAPHAATEAVAAAT
jgi:iron complex transport system ATP-binding protein